MYQTLKRIFKIFVPNTLLFKIEPGMRKLLYLFYKGDHYHCNVCGGHLRKFIMLQNGDRLCPQCGSMSRSRRLWQILNQGLLDGGPEILDFSPSRSLYRAFKATTGIRYFSTDISGDFLSDYHYDITKIEATANRFDLIICYHVLEHVENDLAAMKELYRVLRPGGHCLVQTPFKEGAIYEDPLIRSKEERLLHFEQEDHVRIYSIEGLKERLEQCGFNVQAKQYQDQPGNVTGFNLQEVVLFCKK